MLTHVTTHPVKTGRPLYFNEQSEHRILQIHTNITLKKFHEGAGEIPLRFGNYCDFEFYLATHG